MYFPISPHPYVHRAISLWYSIVTKLIEEYAKRDSGDYADTTDMGMPSLGLGTKRGAGRTSLKIIQKIATPIHKRKKAVVVGECISVLLTFQLS